MRVVKPKVRLRPKSKGEARSGVLRYTIIPTGKTVIL